MSEHDRPKHDESAAEPGPSWGATAGHDPAARGRAEEPSWSQGPQAGQAREWLAQLQSMIENLATQAAPVAKEIGAKAAELAAVAAEKAGPIAARAAEVTADAGTRFAERSRSLATELRRELDADGQPDSMSGAGEPPSGGSSGGSSGGPTDQGDASSRAG
jgi:hypothetical protein